MNRATRVALAVTIAALAAACTSTTNPKASSPPSSGTAPPPTASTTPTTRPLPPPPPVVPAPAADADGSNPDSVTQVALGLMWEVDTTRQTSFADGLRRAEPLLTPQYAGAVQTGPSVKPDAQWQQWTQHQAYTTAATTPSPEDRPADTATAAHRAIELTVIPTGRDGWRGEQQDMIALVTLSHIQGKWLINRIDYS